MECSEAVGRWSHTWSLNFYKLHFKRKTLTKITENFTENLQREFCRELYWQKWINRNESITPECYHNSLCVDSVCNSRALRTLRENRVAAPFNERCLTEETEVEKNYCRISARAWSSELELVGVWRATSPPRCVHNVYAGSRAEAVSVRERTRVDYRLSLNSTLVGTNTVPQIRQ